MTPEIFFAGLLITTALAVIITIFGLAIGELLRK